MEDLVKEIESFEVDGGSLKLKCRTDGDRLLPIRIFDYGSGIIRIIVGDREGEDKFPLFELPEDWKPKTSEFSENQNHLNVDSDHLRIEITKDPFRMRVLDKNNSNREIWAQVDDDLNVGGQRLVGPLCLHQEGDEITAISDSYSLAEEEKIFGFGEKFTHFDKVGQRIRSWVEDAHGTGTDKSYMETPFFMSNLGYGIFFNTTAEMVHEVGYPQVSSGSYRVELKDSVMDYFLFYGPEPKEILKKYTALTGRPEVPPAWTFGLWMSRCFYDDGDVVLDVARRLSEEGISADVMNFDARTWLKPGHQTNFEWDPDRYESPEKLMGELDELGFKTCFWENPYVSDKTELFQEGKESGYFLTDPEGNVEKIKWIPEEYEDFPSTEPSGIVDFTNPEARDWWKKQHEDFIQMGADAFKTDFGDMVPKNSRSAAGINGDMLHNLYPLLFVDTVFEALEEWGKQGVVWDRPGWAGIQKYPIKWGGDPQTTFRAMAQTLRGGLSAGLSGVSFWSHDIGGFYGEKPDPGLYIRWAQFGLLSSHSRCHGTTPREPWEYGDETLKIFKKFNDLRYRLLPYIYSEAHRAAERGLPLMRPIFLEYPNETRAYQADLEYLFGRDLLVAPVFNEEGERTVYLPDELWYDYWDGIGYEGGKTIEVDVPLDEVPLFVRAGSIIPLAGVQTRIGDRMVKPSRVDIYLGRNGTRDLVNDHGLARLEVKEKEKEVTFRLSVLEGNPLEEQLKAVFWPLDWKPKRVTLSKEDGEEDLSWNYTGSENKLSLEIEAIKHAEIKVKR